MKGTTADFIISRPEKIDLFLERYKLKREDLKCSCCGEPLSDPNRIRAIFPFKSLYIVCDKPSCIREVRNMILKKK